jgi:hypothetical protein
MTVGTWLVGGFAATVVLTALLAGSQGLGFTRLNLPYLLGTVFTPNRDRAKVLGLVLHLINGWLFAAIYLAAFRITGRASPLDGALIGFVHAAFVLTAGMFVMPSLHPRMASDDRPPTSVRQLEPPGFLALHYGVPTPVSVVFSHMVYGAMLGLFAMLSQR